MIKIILSIVGIVGAIYFLGFMTLLSLKLDGYNMVTDMMSELGATGSPFFAEMNIMGFMAIGIVLIIFGYNFYDTLKRSIFADVTGLLIIIGGFFMVIVGLFPCDAQCQATTLIGWMHYVLSAPQIIALPMAAIISSLAIYKDKRWESNFWWASSLVLGTLAYLSGALLFLPELDEIVGLLQRAGTASILAWVLLISVKLLSIQRNGG